MRLSSLWLLRLLRREACTWFALRAGGRQDLTYPFAAVMCMVVECVVLDALQCVSGKRRRVLPGNQPERYKKYATVAHGMGLNGCCECCLSALVLLCHVICELLGLQAALPPCRDCVVEASVFPNAFAASHLPPQAAAFADGV